VTVPISKARRKDKKYLINTFHWFWKTDAAAIGVTSIPEEGGDVKIN